MGTSMQADRETLQELQSDSDAMQEHLQQLGMTRPAETVCCIMIGCLVTSVVSFHTPQAYAVFCLCYCVLLLHECYFFKMSHCCTGRFTVTQHIYAQNATCMQQFFVSVQRKTKSALRGIMMTLSLLSTLARMSFGKKGRRGVQRQMRTAKQGIAPVNTVSQLLSLVFHKHKYLQAQYARLPSICRLLRYSEPRICTRAV